MISNDKSFNEFFSEYYDLLYTTRKKYYEESINVINIFSKYGLTIKDTILDFGCGTGEHAVHIAKEGFRVLGIDISENMIQQAQKKAHLQDSLTLSFKVTSLQNLSFKGSYIYSIGSVINYFWDLEEVLMFFKTLNSKLEKNGLYIFDTWHGEVIMKEKPIVMEDSLTYPDLTIQRKVIPTLLEKEKICLLNYNYVIHKNGFPSFKGTSDHRFKLFMKNELEEIFKQTNFEIIATHGSLANPLPLTIQDRYVCYVIKKIK